MDKQEEYKNFFRKRCLKVLIPWIAWTLIYMIYDFTLNVVRISSFSSLIHFFFRVFLSSFWFLPMIFSLYLLTPLFRIFVKHATIFDNYYFISLWFLIASVLPFLFNSSLFPRWEANAILSPIYYSGYFLLGHILIKQKFLKIKNLFALFIIGFSPFIISILPFNTGLIQEFSSGFLFPGTVITSIFLFNFLLIASQRLEKSTGKPVRKFITAVSSASFGVYLIHTILINIFGEKILNFLHAIHGEVLLTPIAFSLLTILIYLLQKIPVLKKLVP